MYLLRTVTCLFLIINFAFSLKAPKNHQEDDADVARRGGGRPPPPKPRTNYTLQFSGLWGKWVGQKNFPDYSYGCGAALQLQEKQGKGDDTAANGVKFKYCNIKNWNQQGEQSISGPFGEWKEMKMCPTGQYITGFQVRFQESQKGGDDTALNGLKIFCRIPLSAQQQRSEVLVEQGFWGDWKDIKTYQNYLMSDFNLRIQSRQKDKDDTALNGIQIVVSRVTQATLNS